VSFEQFVGMYEKKSFPGYTVTMDHLAPVSQDCAFNVIRYNVVVGRLLEQTPILVVVRRILTNVCL